MVLEDGPEGSLKFRPGGYVILFLENDPGRSLKFGSGANVILDLEDRPEDVYKLDLEEFDRTSDINNRLPSVIQSLVLYLMFRFYQRLGQVVH